MKSEYEMSRSNVNETMQVNNKKVALLFLSEISGIRASCFRQEKIVRTYLKNNIEAVVVDTSFTPAKVYRFIDILDFDHFRKDIREKAKSPPSIREGRIINVLRSIKHKILFDVTNPIQWLSCGIVYFKLYDLYNQNVIYVVGSSPSIICMIWARIYGKFFNADRLLLDFRDEWAYHPFLPSNHNKLKSLIEKWLLEKAVACSVSKDISDRIEKRTGYPVLTVYNGPDIHLKNEYVKSIDNRIVITYTGSMPQGSFDVSGLKNIISEAVRLFPEIQFRFIGACNELEKILPSVEGKIIYLEHMPLREVRRKQMESNILMFLGANFPNNGGVVSAKIFEYLQSEKYILPMFVYPGSDVNYIISSACDNCPSIFNIGDFISTFSKGYESLPKLKDYEFLRKLNEDIETFFIRGEI